MTLILSSSYHASICYSIVQDLDLLLQLEYEHGTPKRFTPAIEDVLNYLQNVIIYCYKIIIVTLIFLCKNVNQILSDSIQIRSSKATNDITMRYVIYSLLSGEGSLQSQLVSIHTCLHVAVVNLLADLHCIDTTRSPSRG